MATRSYSSGDRTALIALSRGSCAWPGCGEPIVRQVEREYVVSAQIAHICGLEPGSARYDPDMSDEDRNAIANLIFLCFPHHRTVDKHADKYPREVLRTWKAQGEGPGVGALRGLGGLTEERLQDMIQDAYAQRDEEVNATLDRLERQGDDAANVIRELLAELDQVRSGSGPLINVDVVAMLDEASLRLVDLEATASLASEAADKLTGLEDVVSMLNDAAENIRRAQGEM